jgi:hypothetical protein
MDTADKKLNLIERLVRVKKDSTLQQVEEILIQAEMESRARESIKAIENDEVVSLDKFAKNNQSWLKKKTIG